MDFEYISLQHGGAVVVRQGYWKTETDFMHFLKLYEGAIEIGTKNENSNVCKC